MGDIKTIQNCTNEMFYTLVKLFTDYSVSKSKKSILHTNSNFLKALGCSVIYGGNCKQQKSNMADLVFCAPKPHMHI